MLSIAVLTGADSADYYLRKVACGLEDYYLGDGEAPGQWIGDGAATLGLTGRVSADALHALLEGHDPATGADLTTQRRRNRVPGYDLTFNAPKSVSLLFGLGPPELAGAVRQAHDTAAAAALGYLERAAGHVRRGRDGTVIEPGRGLVGAAFRHRTSRAGDPHLHTHVLVPNLVQGADGRWNAVDGRALFHQAKTAGMLYRAQLRHELRGLGLAWDVRPNGLSEITGVPAPVLRAFSRRRGEIEARLDQLGLDGPRAAQVATLDTRRPKHTVNAHRLADDWHARTEALGFDQPARDALLGQAVDRELDVPAEHAAMLADTGLTATAASFDRRNVLQALATLRDQGAPVTDLEAAADTFLTEPQVVPLGLTVDSHGQRQDATPRDRRYTTTGMLAVEASVLASARDRAHAAAGTVALPTVAAVLGRHPGLNGEQQLAVVRLLTSGAGIDVLVGKGGAGKTHILAAAHHGWQTAGCHVIGTTVAARASARLADTTGIPSWNLTRLLADLDHPGHGPLPPNTVIVVDEAGMAGTRQLARLAEIAARDNAKLVLVGDYRQLPEIDAGGLFRSLAENATPIELVTNMRQAEPWEREALDRLRDAAPARAVAALEHYQRHGRVVVAPSIDQSRAQLVADWWTTLNDTAQADGRTVASVLAENPDAHVILTVRRRAAADLNARARQHLADAGLLSEPSITVTARRLGQRTFAVGDLVVARVNDDRRSGLLNSDLGTVVAVDPDKHELTVQLPNGNQHTVSRRYLERGGLDHGYAHTLHRAQGLTADHVLLEANDALYREALYTGLSRGRSTTRIYATAPDPDRATRLLRDEHHPAPVEPDPLTTLTTAARRSKGQHAATDLRHAGAPSAADDSRRLHADRDGIAGHVAVTALAADDPSQPDAIARHARDLDADLARHRSRLGRLAEQHARTGQRPDLTGLLGPPPNGSDGRRTWRDAAAAVDGYRQRWQITDPDRPLGPAPSPADPPARHDDWHRARRAADEARTRLDRPASPARELADLPDRQLRDLLDRADQAERHRPPDQRAALAQAQQRHAAAVADLAAAVTQLPTSEPTRRWPRLLPRRAAGQDVERTDARRRADLARERAAAAERELHGQETSQRQHEQWQRDTADDRARAVPARDELHHRAALRVADAESTLPEHLRRSLGPAPDDDHRRALWRHTAHTIETYRLRHDITDPYVALGPAPADTGLAVEHEHVTRAVDTTAIDLGIQPAPPDLGLDLAGAD